MSKNLPPFQALLTAVSSVHEHANNSIHSGTPMDAEWVAGYLGKMLDLVASEATIARHQKALMDAIAARALKRMPDTA